MSSGRRILVSVGFVVLGAVIVALAGWPYVRNLNAQRGELAQQTIDLGQRLDHAQSRAASLQDKLGVQDQTLAAADARERKLEAQLADQQRGAKEEAARVNLLGRTVQEAHSDAERAREAGKDLERQLAQQRADTSVLEQRIAQRGDALSQAHERQQKLETSLAAAREVAKEATARVSELGNQLDGAHGSTTQLQNQLDEQRTQLTAEKALSAERADALAQALDRQRKAQVRLVKATQLSAKDAARIDALSNELAQARDRQQALQARVVAATAAQQQIATQVAGLEHALPSAKEPDSSTAPITSGPATGGNEPLQHRLAALQTQFGQYTAEKQALEQRAQRNADALAHARQEAARLTASYRAQLEEAAQLKRVNSGTLDKLGEMRNALEKAQSEIARLEGARGIYTVQGADSLSLIAAFFYHNGNRWPKIFKSNAFLLSDPDRIFPGMVVIIPQ